MSHNLQERDIQAGLKMAWHRMTKIPKSGVITKKFAFGFDVIKSYLYREDGSIHADDERGYKYFTPICTDDNLPVGAGIPLNENTYSLYTPHESWDLIQSFMEGTEHEIVSAGTVDNRSKFFITIRLNQLDAINAGGRKFEFYLNAISSMDKALPLTFVNSSICTVCENTMIANFFAESMFKHKLKHTKNLKEQLEIIKKVLDDTFGIPAVFKGYMDQLANTPVKEEKARQIFIGELASPDAEQEIETSKNMNTRLSNTLESHMGLFYDGLGNEGENMLDVLSARTQYLTRGDNDKASQKEIAKVAKREYDLRANSAQLKKVQFGRRLIDDDSVTALASRGRKIDALASLN